MKRKALIVLALSIVLVVVLLANTKREPKPVSFTHPTTGVEKVVLRASGASTAKIIEMSNGQVEVTGLPQGGAQGYNSPIAFWREKSADRWGLGFSAKQYGSVLVVSTVNEIQYMHHYYHLSDIVVHVPKGVQIELEDRDLNGDGSPDLSAPPQSGN